MYKKKEFEKLTSLYDVHIYKGINGIAMRYCHKKLECFKGKEKYKYHLGAEDVDIFTVTISK